MNTTIQARGPTKRGESADAETRGPANRPEPKPGMPRFLVDSADMQQSGPVSAAAGASGGLPYYIRSNLERSSGMDFSDVRVHRDSSEPARFGARALTNGQEIHLGPGYEDSLAHEAWHVVQQRQGRVQPTGRVRGQAVNRDPALEREANAARVGVLPPSGAPIHAPSAAAPAGPVLQLDDPALAGLAQRNPEGESEGNLAEAGERGANDVAARAPAGGDQSTPTTRQGLGYGISEGDRSVLFGRPKSPKPWGRVTGIQNNPGPSGSETTAPGVPRFMRTHTKSSVDDIPQAVRAGLRACFGPRVDQIGFATREDQTNQAINALAHTQAEYVLLSSSVDLGSIDPRSMEILGHEVAHALSPQIVSRPRLLSQGSDANERIANDAGKQFASFARRGFEGPAPRINPTTPRQALIHRYESDEHRRAVDQALFNILSSEFGEGQDPAEIARLITIASPHLTADITLSNGLTVSPGDITALTGDFYAARYGGNVDVEQSYLRLNDWRNTAEMSALIAAFNRERAGEHLSPSEFEGITAGRRWESYLELAEANDPHFSAPDMVGTDNNMGTYQAFHNAALDAAANGNRERAYILESMAMHYLTDRHASGHLLNKRGIMHGTGALIDFSGNLRALWLHDYYNRQGIATQDALGNQWTAYGDKHWDIEENAENRYRTSISVLTSWAELGNVLDDPSRLEEVRNAQGAQSTVPQFNEQFQSDAEDFASNQGILLTTRAAGGNIPRTPVSGILKRMGGQSANFYEYIAGEFNSGMRQLSTPAGWWRLFMSY